jgi:hypothetical protein
LPGGWPILGTADFGNTGIYKTPYAATYKARIVIRSIGPAYNENATAYVYSGGIQKIELTKNTDLSIPQSISQPLRNVYDGEFTAGVGEDITFWVSDFTNCYELYYGILDITDLKLGYGMACAPHLNLPDLTQTEFIKMICNMFGLIPDVTPRDRKIRFWNYLELYDNIPIARDWSAYLSEREDEMEFKFGDYAQNNYLRYKESDDVIKDNGMGTMQIDDKTLPMKKDTVELPVSTCDEVTILTNIFSVDVSRIGFNKYNVDTSVYNQNESIDPRIVYIDFVKEIASPPYQKTFGISDAVTGIIPSGFVLDIITPKKASSLEVSFSSLVTNYASLSRLLTKTNLRRAKFNLPVYEVAGLKHYIPIYLSQYKAYFYVNKINNYIPGQLCTIDLIKL